MGAHVELVDAGFGINFKESWEKALEDVRREGGKPYAIPAGASDHPLGGLGYVGFAEEVRAQEAALGFRFDYIFVCSVTGSTQAGMVVGFAADGRAARVIGIDASAKPEATFAQILQDRANEPPTWSSSAGRSPATTWCSTPATAARAYGIPSGETNEAIRLAARLEGMMTDPVYEGKSMQGMIDMIRAGRFPPARACSTRISAACRRSTPTAFSTATAEDRPSPDQGEQQSCRHADRRAGD